MRYKKRTLIWECKVRRVDGLQRPTSRDPHFAVLEDHKILTHEPLPISGQDRSAKRHTRTHSAFLTLMSKAALLEFRETASRTSRCGSFGSSPTDQSHRPRSRNTSRPVLRNDIRRHGTHNRNFLVLTSMRLYCFPSISSRLRQSWPHHLISHYMPLEMHTRISHSPASMSIRQPVFPLVSLPNQNVLQTPPILLPVRRRHSPTIR